MYRTFIVTLFLNQFPNIPVIQSGSITVLELGSFATVLTSSPYVMIAQSRTDIITSGARCVQYFLATCPPIHWLDMKQAGAMLTSLNFIMLLQNIFNQLYPTVWKILTLIWTKIILAIIIIVLKRNSIDNLAKKPVVLKRRIMVDGGKVSMRFMLDLAQISLEFSLLRNAIELSTSVKPALIDKPESELSLVELKKVKSRNKKNRKAKLQVRWLAFY